VQFRLPRARAPLGCHPRLHRPVARLVTCAARRVRSPLLPRRRRAHSTSLHHCPHRVRRLRTSSRAYSTQPLRPLLLPLLPPTLRLLLRLRSSHSRLRIRRHCRLLRRRLLRRRRRHLPRPQSPLSLRSTPHRSRCAIAPFTLAFQTTTPGSRQVLARLRRCLPPLSHKRTCKHPCQAPRPTRPNARRPRFPPRTLLRYPHRRHHHHHHHHRALSHPRAHALPQTSGLKNSIQGHPRHSHHRSTHPTPPTHTLKQHHYDSTN
jgi:hypothetical protein